MAFPENTVNDTGIKHIWDKVTAALSGKVDKVSGKGLSTNDYTTAEKEKLSGIEAGAQVNAVTSVAGKTGAVTLDKADVGLGNVDNTSDASKPISTATQNALDTKADTSEVAGTQTATGNPITLTDGSETYAQGLSVDLEPVQDLHGYDFPWVGGAGKNKLGPTQYGGNYGKEVGEDLKGGVAQTYTITNSGEITMETSTAWAGVLFATPPLEAGSYSVPSQFISANGGNTRCSIYVTDSNLIVKSAVAYRQYVGNYNIQEITVESGDRIAYGVANNTANTSVTIPNFYISKTSELASGYSPYENICPISGYEGVEVEDVGVNQWDEEYASGYLDANGIFHSDPNYLSSKYFIPIKPNTQYYLYSGTYNGFVVFYFDDSEQLISYENKGKNTTFTTPPNTAYIKFGNNYGEGSAYNNDISINYPATDTNYHPYQSRTASVTFGQTVYGGVSDFTEGGTDDEIAFIKDTHITNISEGSDGNADWLNVVFATDIDILLSDTVAHRQELAERSMSNYSGEWEYENVNGHVHFYSGARAIYAFYPKSVFPTLSDFTTYYANNKAEFAIPYETASTISTPPTDLKLLQDTNNLTTNGTTITLDYIPNNSIGDAVKASEEYTDRAVGRVAPKATLIDTWMISEESDTISVDLTSYDCNFFLLEYLFNSKRGTTLIPRPSGGSFSASVVTYNNGSALYIELDYNPTTKELAYTSNITSQFGILAIYTI